MTMWKESTRVNEEKERKPLRKTFGNEKFSGEEGSSITK